MRQINDPHTSFFFFSQRLHLLTAKGRRRIFFSYLSPLPPEIEWSPWELTTQHMRGCMQLPLLTKLRLAHQQTGPLPRGLDRWQVYEKRPGMMGKKLIVHYKLKLIVHYARTLKNSKSVESTGLDKIPAKVFKIASSVIAPSWTSYLIFLSPVGFLLMSGKMHVCAPSTKIMIIVI